MEVILRTRESPYLLPVAARSVYRRLDNSSGTFYLLLVRSTIYHEVLQQLHFVSVSVHLASKKVSEK